MNLYKAIFFTLLWSHFGNYLLLAQSPQAMSQFQIKSPEVYAFEKYGNIPIRLHTGALDLDIPIYSIPLSNGQTINVTLTYDSSGFLPHKKNDNAGHGWNLLAGGKITRTINMIPDEYEGVPLSEGSSPFGEPLDIHGYLHGVRIQPFSNTQVYDVNNGGAGNTNGIHWWVGGTANGQEGEPDLFQFSILNIQGTFMIGNDGSVKVQSNDPALKVDITNFKTFRWSEGRCIPELSEIKLIDGKGNSYYFGGDMTKFEIPYYRSSPPGGDHLGYSAFPAVNSFSISKIKFADGSEAIFEYLAPTGNENFQESFCTLMTPGHNNFVKNNPSIFSVDGFSSYGTSIYSWENCPNGPHFCSSVLSSGPANSDTFLLMRKSTLYSIKYKDTTIKINHKDMGYAIKYYKNLASNHILINESLVDNVELYYQNNLIKKTTLNYTDLGGTHKRSFLTKIEKEAEGETTKEVYSLEYSNTTNLPPYYTNGLDHWGFWNGNDGNTTLTAFDTYNATTGDYTLNNTIRDPKADKYNVGLLSKIIYPTKGYTIFEYESPHYGKRIERNSSSNFLPVLTNNNGFIGGARIFKKTDYSANNTISKQVRYKYTTDLNSNTSSGILMNWPRYIYYIVFSGQGYSQSLMTQSSSNVQKNSLDSYNIGYNKVFEIEEENGYTEYNFTSYEDFPDQLTPDVNNIRRYLQWGQVSPENLYKNIRNLYGIDKSILRGKLKNKKIFDNNNTLLSEEIISYTDNTDFNPNSTKDNNNFVSIQHLTGNWVQGYKKYFNPYYEKSITRKDYFSNGTVQVTRTNFYENSNHLQLTKQTSTNSSGEEIRYEYKYPQDLEWDRPYLSILVAQNRVADPVQTKTYNSTQSTPLSTKEIIYDDFNLSPYVYQVLPKYIFTKKNSNDVNISPTGDDLEITYDKYDIQGNLTQYTLVDGTPVRIVWGYGTETDGQGLLIGGPYPIAKIENPPVNDSNFESYIHNLKNSSLSGNPGDLELIFLQMIRIFPNSKITGYTYEPLIGVKSITQNNGQKETYEYDGFGRLIQVLDHNGKVLKKINYNYKD